MCGSDGLSSSSSLLICGKSCRCQAENPLNALSSFTRPALTSASCQTLRDSAMPAARRRRLWPGTVPDHVGNACGSARNHLGDSRVSPTESAQTAGKSIEYVFSWHYALANFPGPNQSFQRFAPDAQAASVEDQSR